MKKAHPGISRIYSIKVKIGVIMILLNTLIFFGFGLYQYLDSKQQETRRLITFASHVASQLSINLVSPLWDIEERQIQRAVEAEMQDENILMIVVKDQTDKKLTAKTRNEAWAIVDAPQEVTIPNPPTVAEIVRENKTIGMVEVYITDRFLQAQLNMTMKKTGLTVVVCDIVLFALLLISVRWLLIRPLARLLLRPMPLRPETLARRSAFDSRTKSGH